MEIGWIAQVVAAMLISGATCLSVQRRAHRKELKGVEAALAAVQAEMAKLKELSDARQRNFEREMVRSGALGRENAALLEKLNRAQTGRGGFVPMGMTLYLN